MHQRTPSTQEQHSEDSSAPRQPKVPRLVAIFSQGQALSEVIPWSGANLILGRESCSHLPDDAKMSRRHVQLVCTGSDVSIRDLGSRNGTFVDGKRLDGELRVALKVATPLRLGNTLFVLQEAPILAQSVIDREPQQGMIAGWQTQAAFARIRQIAQESRSLLILGESGTGKERAARLFHDAGPHRHGPFIAINCATIPETLAESLLFGSVRGAFSGAVNANGYLCDANYGTLFLDEVGELAWGVQAKLLRVLETGNVAALGSTQQRTLSTRFCFATWRNLRAMVNSGHFRPDLFYRIAQTMVTMPPLRERLEEIPWHIARVVEGLAPSLVVQRSFVEACLHRTWSGNLRSLQNCVHSAVLLAKHAGESQLRREHIADDSLDNESCILAPKPLAEPRPASRSVDPRGVSLEAIQQALAEHGGNRSAAARTLGLHRSQLYRLLEEHELLKSSS